jgi:alanine dehydrogenase
MLIGCPKEIKNQEYRVGMTPAAALEAISRGHKVIIEKNAGVGAGFPDDQYTAVGAVIVDTAAEIFATADMVVKVKEPQPVERKQLRENQILFTYLHLAPDPDQTRDLLASGVTGIAYETVTDRAGGLPLLAPMSEVAGKLAPQVGAWTLQKANGGRGVLLGGVPGVGPARVVVIGGGVVGTHAARVAAGMGADVSVLDMSLNRMRYLDDVFGHQFKTRYASKGNTHELIADADLVIGAVLVPGAEAPKLVSRADLGMMRPGAAIVDVATIRVVVLKPRTPQPMTIRSMKLTVSCITAWRICRVRLHVRQPLRWGMRRCRSCWLWLTRAGAKPARMMRIC